MPMTFSVLAACIFGAIPPPQQSRSEEVRSRPSAELVATILETSDRRVGFPSAAVLLLRLGEGGAGAEEVARVVLGHRGEIVDEPGASAAVDGLAARGEAVRAAEWLVHAARAQVEVRAHRKGRVVLGRVVVEDGQLDPELVLAQTPILGGGYFAATAADPGRPLGFRAEGYEPVDASLAGKDAPLIFLGDVAMRPVPPAERAGIRGRVTVDDPAGLSKVVAVVKVDMPPLNSASGGYIPSPPSLTRTLPVPVAPDGSFRVDGLSPGDHWLIVNAEGHVTAAVPLKLAAGREEDAGTVALKAYDLGFYLKRAAPKSNGIAWEASYAAAAKKAREERKPLMVMATATWCGPCKMLEKETLSDPWVRHFLSGFVAVKAYEDEEFEGKHPIDLYPTLVFLDPDGVEAYRTAGFRVPVPFAAEIAPAFAKLGMATPPELQELLDREVLTADRPGVGEARAKPASAQEKAPGSP